MKRALLIAKRDLAGLFLTPIAYVVGVMFLAIQGFSFWAIANVLSDPRQPVGYGAVLSTHFGGTTLYWTILFTVIAVISMRLCAEERRQGTWETLLTTPVSELEVVVGKWLAGCGFYAFLWLPTLLFPLALQHFSPPDVTIDAGPIAAAYVGVLLTGGAFLAIGVAISASTEAQVLAAAGTFAVGMAFLFAGQLDELGASASLAPGLVDVIDLRRHMESFSRGAIPWSGVLLFAGLTVTALAFADAISVVGRRPRWVVRGRFVTGFLCAVLLGLGLVWVDRAKPREWDWTAARQNSLAAHSRNTLDALTQPVALVLIRPSSQVFDSVFVEVERLLRRMVQEQPLLRLSELDAALQPERVAAVAAEFALSPNDLVDGGAVLIEQGGRRRVVELLDMAEFGRDPLGAGAMTRFRAEGALVQALAELSDSRSSTLCYSEFHSELPRQSSSGPNWTELAEGLTREGFELRERKELNGTALAGCDVVMLLGPERPLFAAEALAIATYLENGGRLFLALASHPERAPEADVLPATGLEALLGGYGLSTPPAIVLDPGHEVGIPLAWMTSEGYGDHPIARPFDRRRLTVWLAPRPVLGGQSLVSPSPAAWGERDLAALNSQANISADAKDILGGPAVAAAVEKGKARLVVFGSASSLSSVLAERGMTGVAVLARASVSWLAGRAVAVDVVDKPVERVRLIMDAGQRRFLFAVCVLLLPLSLLLLGTAVMWYRRR